MTFHKAQDKSVCATKKWKQTQSNNRKGVWITALASSHLRDLCSLTNAEASRAQRYSKDFTFKKRCPCPRANILFTLPFQIISYASSQQVNTIHPAFTSDLCRCSDRELDRNLLKYFQTLQPHSLTFKRRHGMKNHFYLVE